MEPGIISCDAFTVTGVQERLHNEDPNLHQALWMERYMPHDEELRPFSTDKGYYSVCFAINRQEYCLDGMAARPGSRSSASGCPRPRS